MPDGVQVRIDRCEDIEQVLDIYIPRYDPSCLSEVGLVRIKINRQSDEVTVLDCAEERR